MDMRLAKISVIAAVAALLIGTHVSGVSAQKLTFNPNGTVTLDQPVTVSAIDFKHAKPMPMPKADVGPSAEVAACVDFGTPGFEPGTVGNGKMDPQTVPRSIYTEDDEDRIEPAEYGTAGIPYTTSRVDLQSAQNVSKLYPYRAVGKLYFNSGSDTYTCTASLIKRGLIVTAAHCVASYGNKKYFSNWLFIPALYISTAPYGKWTGTGATILTSYYSGADNCAQYGVVCPDDVAVIRLVAQSGAFPGDSTGVFAYGYNGWGFTGGKTLINQLGYPLSLDSGVMMQRTDSQGSTSSGSSNNVTWGSRQTGGSSGGPALNNLGWPATFNGNTYGTAYGYNTVIGVTSWESSDPAQKRMGASPFTSSNIVKLVATACAAGNGGTRPACQ
jgi:V8-like Glu-specific endopeptidase